jgi:hypothetical protein
MGFRVILLYLGLASIALCQLNTSSGPIAFKVFIEPDNGFESYISAAIVKKHTPVVITSEKESARYVLTSVVLEKNESTGGKIARCIFAYCAGIEGSQTATVRLIDKASNDVIWAYNVRKGSASAYQSSAEAVAKHLKEFLEKNPKVLTP